MKNRITYLFLLLLSVALTTNAQVGDSRRDFAVGVASGVTMNTINFNPRINQSFKISPQYGVAARYICEKYFNSICGVQIEANYQDLGWKELIEDGTDNQYKCNLRFIEIPFLMQMGWGKEQKGLKFLFEAGPVIDFYLSKKEEREGHPWSDSHRPNNVIHQYYYDIDNHFTYGIAAGIGVEHSSFLGHFMLEARYLYGLGDLYDNSKKGYFGRSSNQTIELKLTYLFDLIKTKRDR